MAQRPPYKRPRRNALVLLDHVVRVAHDQRQPEFLCLWQDSCVNRLFVCTSSLSMISSHWCVPPSRSRKTLALWLPSSRSSGRCRRPRCCWKSAACSSPPSSSSGRDRPRSRGVGHGEGWRRRAGRGVDPFVTHMEGTSLRI